ncbi:ABC transporter ATP-binding protein [Dehalogenimonas sp. THU2]|uniref:ABC transporter ATP-binding protein n=1 Tax=Dehalogenimonas sp. THU2 TaxID=3151121 RepID=UPI00321869CD
MINVTNASFSYGKGDVFRDVNLQVNRGEIYCLLGPNGCGKSTLILCILGVLKTANGSVSLDGQDIRDLKPRDIARLAAYIPQVHEKPFPYKVIDVVLMGRTAYSGTFSPPSAQDRIIAEEALAKAGIAQFAERPYTQLSGGETQLVIVARALAQQTPILVLDEPTSHLDFHNELYFLQSIVRLVQESNLTVVMATHSPNHAFYFEGSGINTRVGLMNHQIIAVQGSPSAALTEENMAKTFNIRSKVVCYQWEGVDLKQIIPLEITDTVPERKF